MNLTDVFNNNASGMTALHHAMMKSDAETVRKLFEHGADVNAAPDLPRPKRPVPMVPKPRSSAQDITAMATDRNVLAPATARFKRKPQKRKTVL